MENCFRRHRQITAVNSYAVHVHRPIIDINYLQSRNLNLHANGKGLENFRLLVKMNKIISKLTNKEMRLASV